MFTFPTLISCSPNLPRVYIKLCRHGNHFTFLQSRENLFLILCEGLRRLNCGKVTNDQSNYLFQRFLVTIYQRFFYHQINGVENYEITKCFCVTNQRKTIRTVVSRISAMSFINTGISGKQISLISLSNHTTPLSKNAISLKHSKQILRMYQ